MRSADLKKNRSLFLLFTDKSPTDIFEEMETTLFDSLEDQNMIKVHTVDFKIY